MDKQKFSRICGLAALILTAVFAADVIRDWVVYNTTLNSAPFYIWVAVDALLLLLPAAVCCALYFYFRSRH